jgi:crotonobetainyl-CoA:carnitine CoA-transferase CaiB-like acyl-CoA transferase
VRGQQPQDVLETLQGAGVPAGRVLDTGSIHDDPQLLRRGFWTYLPNPKMIRYKQANVSWRFLEANPALQRHAPFFGEHTREILTGVVGLSDAEVDELYAAGITGDEPVNPVFG